MTISTSELLALAFIPGVAESNKAKANQAANMAWDGLFTGVINARNTSYIALAISVICAIGALLITPATFGAGMVIGSLALASATSGTLCIASLAKLHKSVKNVQNVLACFSGF